MKKLFFISLYSGADGLTMLNLVIPIYGLMYAFGSMVGIGSAIRYALKKASGDENTDFYFTHALSWDLILSIPFILLGIFAPQWVLLLMGADARITELGIQYLRIILIGSPFFMMNYAFTAFARNDNATTIAMIGSLSGSAFNVPSEYGNGRRRFGNCTLPYRDHERVQYSLFGQEKYDRLSLETPLAPPSVFLLQTWRLRIYWRNCFCSDNYRIQYTDPRHGRKYRCCRLRRDRKYLHRSALYPHQNEPNTHQYSHCKHNPTFCFLCHSFPCCKIRKVVFV